MKRRPTVLVYGIQGSCDNYAARWRLPVWRRW